MKKAKIVLSAVALFAVVGGAFAFKAARYNPTGITFSYSTTLPNGQLTTLCSINRTYTTTNLPAAPVTTYYTSIANNSICSGPTFTSRVTTTLLGM